MQCVPVDPHAGTSDREALCHLVTMDYEYRTMDGSDNNKKNEDYGVKEQIYIRKVEPVYNGQDGCSLNDLDGTRPNPRDVSNCLMSQTDPCPNKFCLSNMFWLWGQFIAHSFSLTRQDAEDCENIPVEDESDPLFGEIEFKRTISDPDKEECGRENPREQINFLTPWIDASNVYGDTEARNDFIREFEGGRLKMDCNGMAPLNNSSQENAGKDRGPNFVFGDIRGNKNLGLASLHTLFVREHNYWAYRICELCPEMEDEEIYQRAKIMVEAELQAVTYNEFLPLLIGECLPSYCYDCELNPQPTNIFSAAAYRLHSMIPSKIINDIQLRELFFASSKLLDCTTTVGSVLSHHACGIAEELDQKIVDDLRNFLFGPPGMGGMDIAALDIQRGRDHGLGSINDYLECFDMDPITSFADISSSTTIQQKLASLYENPSDIDLWLYFQIRSGEDSDFILEPLARAIVKDGFLNIRNGDRLWYENRLTWQQICLVNDTKLSDIIRRNICECDVQDNVFIVPSWKLDDEEPWTKPSKPSNPCDPCQPCHPCPPNPCHPCFDPCKLCYSNPCKCKPTPIDLIYKCSQCKCNPCVCIFICDYCGCHPCRCRHKKCEPEDLIYKPPCDTNPIFFKHSKFSSGYDSTGCFKFPNEIAKKCTSDISDLHHHHKCKSGCKTVCVCKHDQYLCTETNYKCNTVYAKPGCKPCKPHDRPAHCKPCKQVYVVKCRCNPRCRTRCQNPCREVQYIE
jgi:peroxidase